MKNKNFPCFLYFPPISKTFGTDVDKELKNSTEFSGKGRKEEQIFLSGILIYA
jgi:hypothetical protein